MNTHPIGPNKRQVLSRAEAATSCATGIPDFDELPDSAMVRLAQLVRNPKHPSKPVPLPISVASVWRGVAAGSFPQPIKLGPRTTAWRVSDVRAWMAAQAGKDA